MILKSLLKIYSDHNCSKVYVKKLSPNDNSKNQVYFGGSFDILNILPINEIIIDNDGDSESTIYKTKLDFFWVNDEGILTKAPRAQLILYPQYPEVRFSGFLKNSKGAPSELMTNRIDQRLLFLGVSVNRQIVAYVSSPESQLSNEFNQLENLVNVGIFKEIILEEGLIQLNSKGQLIAELTRIHNLGWIDSKRLDKNKNILTCPASNCGGYTLEAELGIIPNGNSEPDYLGWEIKQFSVKDFTKLNSATVTLMTPEPTHGFYVDSGVEDFIRKYGYNDKRGRLARMNFGGVYKIEKTHPLTSLKLIIEGFDSEEKMILNPNGYIGLIDLKDNIAASWSFVTLLKHWNRKHANACYVPSLNRKDEFKYPFSKQQYFYGNNIILGSSTEFSFFLSQMVSGNIYYDPGIKLELAIEGNRKQSIKRRSQFRIKSGNLTNLYKKNEVINIDLNI